MRSSPQIWRNCGSKKFLVKGGLCDQILQLHLAHLSTSKVSAQIWFPQCQLRTLILSVLISIEFLSLECTKCTRIKTAKGLFMRWLEICKTPKKSYHLITTITQLIKVFHIPTPSTGQTGMGTAPGGEAYISHSVGNKQATVREELRLATTIQLSLKPTCSQSMFLGRWWFQSVCTGYWVNVY